MVLSRREQLIGLVTAAVIGLVVLDWIILSPLLDRRANVQNDIRTVEGDVARAEQLVQNAPRMQRRWNEMLDRGLRSDETEAKNQALRQMLEWGKDSGVAFTSLQPDRGDALRKQKDLQQITIRATGSGSMRSLGRFLWKVQTADIPVRVTEIQIDARKPGTDDLMMTLAVSTLCLPPAAETKVAAAAGVTGVTQ